MVHFSGTNGYFQLRMMESLNTKINLLAIYNMNWYKIYVCVCTYIYIYIYIYVWRKIEEQNKPKLTNLLEGKLMLKPFSFNHQDFKMVKQVLIEQRWMFDKIQKRRGECI